MELKEVETVIGPNPPFEMGCDFYAGLGTGSKNICSAFAFSTCTFKLSP